MGIYSYHQNLRFDLERIHTARVYATDADLPTPGDTDILYIVESSESNSNSPVAFMYKSGSYIPLSGDNAETSMQTVELLQLTKLNITTGDDGEAISSTNPRIYKMTVEYDDTYKRPQVSTLKFQAGDEGILRLIHAFDNSDADDFSYDSESVEFDAVMKLKEDYEADMSYSTQISNGYRWSFLFNNLFSKNKLIRFDTYSSYEELLKEYNTILYVDSENGDDSNTGTKDLPYKTLPFAINSLEYNNTCIKLMPGSYYIDDSLASLNIYDFTIVGSFWDSIITSSSNCAETSGENTITVYATIWEYTGFRFFTGTIRLVSYNSVFRSNGYMFYSNHRSNKLNNCIVYNTDSSGGKTSQVFIGGKVELLNTYYKDYENGTDRYSATYVVNTSLIRDVFVDNYTDGHLPQGTPGGANIDENYNITCSGWQNTGSGQNPDGSQAHIGVYGGSYAWPVEEV